MNTSNPLLEILVASSVCPSVYDPTDNMKQADHVALLLNGKPLLLCGWAGDEDALRLAQGLAGDDVFRYNLQRLVDKHILMADCGINAVNLQVATVSGDNIDWQPIHEAIAESEPGCSDLMDTGPGDLMAILLEPCRLLSIILCTTTAARHFRGIDSPLLMGRITGNLPDKFSIN